MDATLTSDPRSVVYLNNTQVSIPSRINATSTFSFSFLACSQGTILSQGDELSISLEKPSDDSVSYHTVFAVNWKSSTSPQKLLVKPAYSLDSNILMKVEVLHNETGIIVRLTPNPAQGQNILILQEAFLATSLTASSGSSITLGSSTFTGCIYSGSQITITDEVKSTCPLDTWAPCQNSGTNKKMMRR